MSDTSLVRRIVRAADQIDRRLSRMNPPELESGEAELHAERVDRITSFLPSPGLLVVTSQRLLFIPRNRDFIPLRRLPAIEVRLEEISDVSRGTWWEGLKGGVPGLRPVILAMKDGRRLAFQSGNAKRLRNVIYSARHKLSESQ